MNDIETIKCSCGKEFIREIITYPAKLEETRRWDTYFTCPYCEKVYGINLSSNEDARSFKKEK